MTSRFSYWKRHHPLLPVYEKEFLKWINGRTDLIRDRDVLDAGCGMARNAVFCAKHGARSVHGVEINTQVIPAAQQNASTFSNITIAAGDLQNLDMEKYGGRFDTVICIGVLHHLPQPQLALTNLSRCLKEGGHLIAMVYAYEGNENFLRMLKPARYVTKHLPLRLLELLALPVTATYTLLLPFLRGEYFELQRQSPFSALHYNIVDQLCPEIAHYWTQAEVRDLFESEFQIQDIVHGNGRTWNVVGEKKTTTNSSQSLVSATEAGDRCVP